MDEGAVLSALKCGDERALEWIIDKYSAYVGTILFNIMASQLSMQDIEEAASDVFCVLWKNAGMIKPGKLKAYLSGAARNIAKDRLRRAGRELPLSDDELGGMSDDPQREMDARSRSKALRQALRKMSQTDRQIFLRRYYYCQELTQISQEMDINLSTVKTRLRRGREKLREVMKKGGWIDENI